MKKAGSVTLELDPVEDAPSASLVDRIIADVSAYIRTRRLEPGAPLPSESTFASEAGVSRAVAREGFRALAALGMIDVGNGRRARVALADESVVSLMINHAVQTRQIRYQEILDVRRALELRTVALAAVQRTDAEAAEIVEFAQKMHESFERPPEVMELDISFHEAIARASRNPLFALLIRSFRVVMRETWPAGWAGRASDDERRSSLAGHSAIAAAIEDRNPQAAERAMADHFDLTIKALFNAGMH